MATRYVVARYCFGGIGDHLLCVIGAWLVARRTGRTLVVDWRGSRFNHDPTGGRNCFFDYFAPVQKLGGVEVIADDTVGEINYPLPMWPDKWNRDTLSGVEHMKHTASEISELTRIMGSDEDPAAATFVLNGWPEPASMPAAVRGMLENLRLTDSIRKEADLFWDAHVGTSPAVAIHLRHGNGENIGNRAAYWLGPISLTRQLVINSRHDIHRAGVAGRFSDNAAASLVGTPAQAKAERQFCNRVAAEFRALSKTASLHQGVPFLFCDSAQIIETMRQALPGLAAWPKRVLGRGEGPLHQLDAGRVRHTQSGGVRGGTVSNEITRDMFIELELLGRCSGLMYMDSGFSILSRIKLDKSRLVHLEPSMVNKFLTKVAYRLTAH
jgi:Nodulation protein Z (NodZ)